MSELLNYAKTLAHEINLLRTERDKLIDKILSMEDLGLHVTFEYSLLEIRLDVLEQRLVELAFNYEEAKCLLEKN